MPKYAILVSQDETASYDTANMSKGMDAKLRPVAKAMVDELPLSGFCVSISFEISFKLSLSGGRSFTPAGYNFLKEVHAVLP